MQVKKLLSLMVLSTAIMGMGKVSAEATNNIYYTNQNGINLTEKEYNLVKNMFDEHFVEIMNQEDYEHISRLDVNNRQVELTIKEPDYIQSRTSSFVETQGKKLVIGKSCDSKACTVIMTNTWKYVPKVKSYDVIGAMFSNTSLYGNGQVTIFKFDGVNHTCNNYVKKSDGIGCSYKLDSKATKEFYTYMDFDVYTGGLVYGSYQHATSSVTLSQSKNYTFHINGYGNVFLFNTTKAKDSYDGMDGVSIYV